MWDLGLGTVLKVEGLGFRASGFKVPGSWNSMSTCQGSLASEMKS